MKNKIILPSLFVLNTFLVGMMPKTSKAGSVAPTQTRVLDTVSYTLPTDSVYWLPQSCSPDFIKLLGLRKDSTDAQQGDGRKDSLSYDISWQGRSWVKYTSDDGSGFIRTGGSRTWRNMNPGALRPGEISRQYGSCGSAGGFAVFPTEEHGLNALRALLRSEKYANLTIAAAVYKYAPPSDNNNPRSYQQKLTRLTGLSLTKRIKQLTDKELERVVFAIKVIEGWTPGTNKHFAANKQMALTTAEFAKLLKCRDLLQNQYYA